MVEDCTTFASQLHVQLPLLGCLLSLETEWRYPVVQSRRKAVIFRHLCDKELVFAPCFYMRNILCFQHNRINNHLSNNNNGITTQTQVSPKNKQSSILHKILFYIIK